MLDYWVTLARLHILDALARPEPDTTEDQQRQCERERMEQAFPKLYRDEPDTVVSNRADRVPTED